jgi:hypothetical protein
MARYALVIGIGQNQLPLPSLSKTVGDAEAITRALEDWGDFRVDCLTQPKQLTQAALTDSIKQFINQKAKLAEVALIYYTGHAVPVVDEFADETEVFLAPMDCVVSQKEQRCTALQSGISLKSLSALLAKADLKNLVMLLDCCHSGELIEPESLKQTFAGEFRSKNYWLLTACRSFEPARAKRSQPHSLFSGAVLRGLAIEQADDRGEITAGKLFGFVMEELRRERQEPQQLSMGSSVVVARHRASVKAVVIDESLCPYQGLNAFTPETKQFFFGRGGEVVELLRKLEDCNFVPVIGPSGIGKSSIVRAGLMPRLKEQGWQILGPMKPGPDPMGELKRSFRDVFQERQLPWVYEQIEAGNLGAVVAELPKNSRFLLVIDQFEEVFTLCTRSEVQRHFVGQLVAIGNQTNSRLAIVTTMRSDFINDWLKTGQPPKVMQDQAVMVGPLVGEDLVAAIVEPAKQLGYGFGEGLLELILADVEAEPNSLPLLEFALAELWEKRDREKRLLTAAAYQDMGRLRGALQDRAEAVYGGLQVSERDWARRICLGLVRIGKGDEDTRQRRLRADLVAMAMDAGGQQMIEGVLNDLVKERLLTSDEGVIDLAHEALMWSWKTLEEWLQQDRTWRRLEQRIEDDYNEWIVHQKNDDYLLSAGPLRELQRLDPTEEAQVLMRADFREFLTLSTQRQSYYDTQKYYDARTGASYIPSKEIFEKMSQEKQAQIEALEKMILAASRPPRFITDINNGNPALYSFIENNKAESESLETVVEVQALLDQLSIVYPSETLIQKVQLVEKALLDTQSNPTLYQRLLRAVKAGSIEAIRQSLNHPATAVFIEAIEAWNDTKK